MEFTRLYFYMKHRLVFNTEETKKTNKATPKENTGSIGYPKSCPQQFSKYIQF